MSSLALQRQAVEHCLALLESSTGSEHRDIILEARNACRTLAWFEKRAELTRALVDLDKRAPGLAVLMGEFPGARIEIPPERYKPNDATEREESAA